MRIVHSLIANSEKNEVVTDGEFIDSETIRVLTPNYELYGALSVDVRVSINGEGWTVNKIQYNYFANTAARNCIAYGPGVLEEGVYGVEMPFIIQVGFLSYSNPSFCVHGHSCVAHCIGGLLQVL